MTDTEAPIDPPEDEDAPKKPGKPGHEQNMVDTGGAPPPPPPPPG